jgi:hypothetical protein
MALTTTTLAAACDASTVKLKITSTASGFPAVGVIGSKQVMRVDGEDMLIDVVPLSGVVKVLLRGFNGTQAVPHDILAQVMTSSDNSDFLPTPVGAVNARPPYVDDIVTIGEDTVFGPVGTPITPGVLPYPTKNTTYIIDKASAAAITLIAIGASTPAPSAASQGVRMTFISGSAQAHTVTYGPGFLGDTTSSHVGGQGRRGVSDRSGHQRPAGDAQHGHRHRLDARVGSKGVADGCDTQSR